MLLAFVGNWEEEIAEGIHMNEVVPKLVSRPSSLRLSNGSPISPNSSHEILYPTYSIPPISPMSNRNGSAVNSTRQVDGLRTSSSMRGLDLQKEGRSSLPPPRSIPSSTVRSTGHIERTDSVKSIESDFKPNKPIGIKAMQGDADRPGHRTDVVDESGNNSLNLSDKSD